MFDERLLVDKVSKYQTGSVSRKAEGRWQIPASSYPIEQDTGSQQGLSYTAGFSTPVREAISFFD